MLNSIAQKKEKLFYYLFLKPFEIKQTTFLVPLFIAIFFILFPIIANAKSLDTKGTDFWLTFTKNASTDAGRDDSTFEPSFFISSENPTIVIIEIKSIGYQESFSIQANVARKIILPDAVETSAYNSKVVAGIRVTSNSEVTIYGLSRVKHSTDAYQGLPTDVLGNDYIVLAYGNGQSSNQSQYTIIGTEDGTQVSIVASIDDPCGITSEISLNAGEVYQHKSCDGGDVSGTEINSTAPIGVFSGHGCVNIPDETYGACDHIVEQLPAISSWGQQFLTVPLASRTKGDTFRILASTNNTTVSINGNSVTILARGEFFQTIINEPSNIVANAPILIAQYSNSSEYDGVTSDPFMMLIPSFEQFLDNYTFSAPTEGFQSNFVNIVVKSSAVSKLKLDSEAIDGSLFETIPGSNFSYAQLPIEPGSHTLKGAVAGVFVYGYDSYDSYGYPGGFSLSKVAEIENVTLLPDYQVIDGSACFKAKVSDILENGLPDVRVDFIVDLFEGSDRTDLDGIAEFCVESGANPGEYSVTVNVGEQKAKGVVKKEEIVTVAQEEECDDGVGNTSFAFVGFLGFVWLIRRKRKSISRRS